MGQIDRKQMSANSTEIFQIESPTATFLVKNYTGGPVYACVGNRFRESDSTMIAANTAEVVQAGVFVSSITVRADSSGIVEVGRFDGRHIFPLAAGAAGQESLIPDEAVTSDDDFDEMMDETFGDDTGSENVQDGDGSVDDDF